jgi:peroxiredoxin
MNFSRFSCSELSSLCLAGFGLLAWVSPAPAQDTFNLQWQPSGIREKVTGFRPHAVLLKAQAPEGLKQAPAGVGSPMYGVIELGPPKSPAKFIVLADAPEGRIQRVFLDSNANGDLTDDPPCTVTNRPYKNRDGEDATAWQAAGVVEIPFAAGPREGALKFYTGQVRAGAGQAPPQLFYYPDYGLVGDVKIGARTVPVVLEDAGAKGHFRLSPDSLQNPLLWLGVTNPVSRRLGLTTPAQRPFEVDGKWWAITNLTLDGAFQIAAASKPVVAEKKPEVDLNPGQKAPAFTAKLTNGKPVKFPDDYRGKVVLLDFWAMWCGPCVAEIPNVVKAYEKYHPQGLEVLGISLDRENSEQKLADFTKKKAMPWPQVYDGKFWQAEVAKLYGIHSIPHMLLVDGDTGQVIANKAIRGDALAPAIEAALAKKRK